MKCPKGKGKAKNKEDYMKRKQVKDGWQQRLALTMTAGMLAGCGNTAAEEPKSEERAENRPDSFGNSRNFW